MFLQRLRRPTTHPPDEAALLRLYRQSGELAVLGTLYEPYLDLVFAVCYQHLRDEEEAKDAVMQVFEKLVVELRRHEVVNFRSWLHSVARNECLMRLRQHRTTAGHVDVFSENGVELAALAHPPDEDSSPLDAHLDRLGPCLEILTREQKTSVTLFFYEEKSYREISDLTGYGLNDVKSYLQNGKRNLKKCLERGEGREDRE